MRKSGYRYVSFVPGVELVLEAFEPYWRNARRVAAVSGIAEPLSAARLGSTFAISPLGHALLALGIISIYKG